MGGISGGSGVFVCCFGVVVAVALSRCSEAKGGKVDIVVGVVIVVVGVVKNSAVEAVLLVWPSLFVDWWQGPNCASSCLSSSLGSPDCCGCCGVVGFCPLSPMINVIHSSSSGVARGPSSFGFDVMLLVLGPLRRRCLVVLVVIIY